MSAAEFALALARFAAVALPLLLAARFWRRAYLDVTGPLAALVEAVLVLSALIIGGELLGLVSALRALPLAALFVCLALAGWVLARRVTPARALQRRTASGPTATRADGETATPAAGWWAGGRWPVLVALAAVIAQWCLATANVLGGGMLSFDSLWYHMPFAGRFAETGSVTAIQFTQADPYVAYYPANSELLHAIGISALHGDLLSPLLNLLWAAVFLLACWCLGERWQVQRHTLLAGCLVLALPVLSTTQPGQAFNDVAGLAMLLAGVALMANTGAHGPMLAVAGLALGFAIGTKVTFLVPGLAIVFGAPWLAPVGERLRAFALLSAGVVLTGGWWYLRNALAVGNPFGQRLQIGPLVIPGPRSVLAAEQQGTVLANIKHLSLWGSRFAPGLSHALGALWPLVLVATVFGCVAGVALLRDPLARLIALTGSLAGLTYFVLPTSASGIARATTLFEANLRYATPAIALGVLLVPIILPRRRPRLVGPASLAILVVLLASQLERSVWPAQPARHAAFLVGAAGLLLLPAVARRLAPALAARRGALPLVALAATVTVGAAAFVVQRHYYSHRYLTGAEAVGIGRSSDGGLYTWAQHVSHTRIALYGTLTQYPLYGARDTNRVDYLGRHTSNGGFVPIGDCHLWKATVNAGHYDYVVLSPSQTGPVPLSWTAADPAVTLALHPGPGYYVFRVRGELQSSLCPQA
ncbi:MAG: hypothetical protein M3065_20105 [Actinomycetota bacterium]|nr:hypothetical protein [Actinomycetota bacterium]